jgi:hypothetical protein
MARYSNLEMALVVALLWGVSGCDRGQNDQAFDPGTTVEIVENSTAELQNACASTLAYERLKALLFNQAVRVGNADPVNMGTLARHSVVRMESPALRSRDDSLDMIVCTGRLVLELAPGAERAFAGERRLLADVEYSAQPALDGSGFVYQLRGAEPIVERLAAFDLSRAPLPRPALSDALNSAQPEAGEPPIAKVPGSDSQATGDAGEQPVAEGADPAPAGTTPIY